MARAKSPTESAGNTAPTVWERRVVSARAAPSGTQPSCLAAIATRSRSSSETTSGRLIARETVAVEMPALIVLDILMPVMNGWQFAQAFRARYGRGVPIVVATAAEHIERRRNGLDVTDVLPKPFEVSDLLRRRWPAVPLFGNQVGG